VLWSAFVVGLAALTATAPGPVRYAHAAEAPAPSSQTDSKPSIDTDAPTKAKKGSSRRTNDDPDVTISPRGIIIDEGDKHVRIGPAGVNREYDSFEQFAKDAPWLAGLVFFVVSLVFLVPLLIIVLLIWYKVRKNRMLNETMIKLAEKGVVPPAEALDALSANRVAATVTSSPSTAPMYEQAKALRRRAATSDLRKGVLLMAVGFGLIAYSMFEDGTPNGLGLILFFVGIGFCVLWFFEERDPTQRPGSPPPGSVPPGGA
jgi:hypothetical protein